MSKIKPSSDSQVKFSDSDFDKLPCLIEFRHINELFKEYQSKHPYAEHFFIMDDEDSDKKIIGVSIDIDQVPEYNQGL